METIFVDVTDLGADLEVGDEVVLMGASGTDEIRATELAKSIDGIVEEIFCGISKSVPREYVGGAERSLRKRSRPPSRDTAWPRTLA